MLGLEQEAIEAQEKDLVMSAEKFKGFRIACTSLRERCKEAAPQATEGSGRDELSLLVEAVQELLQSLGQADADAAHHAAGKRVSMLIHSP